MKRKEKFAAKTEQKEKIIVATEKNNKIKASSKSAQKRHKAEIDW